MHSKSSASKSVKSRLRCGEGARRKGILSSGWWARDPDRGVLVIPGRTCQLRFHIDSCFMPQTAMGSCFPSALLPLAVARSYGGQELLRQLRHKERLLGLGGRCQPAHAADLHCRWAGDDQVIPATGQFSGLGRGGGEGSGAGPRRRCGRRLDSSARRRRSRRLGRLVGARIAGTGIRWRRGLGGRDVAQQPGEVLGEVVSSHEASRGVPGKPDLSGTATIRSQLRPVSDWWRLELAKGSR